MIVLPAREPELVKMGARLGAFSQSSRAMLPDACVNALLEIARQLAPRTEFPKKEAWKSMSEDEIWKRFVYQVAVVGSAQSVARMAASEATQTALNFEGLQQMTVRERRASINQCLRAAGVRYASRDPDSCRKTAAISRNFDYLCLLGGPHAYLGYLVDLASDHERVEHVQRHFSYIKLKGARDLLAELGLVTDVIAFDARVLNILHALGADDFSAVRKSHALYRQLQDELIARVCGPSGLTGVMLDRVLCQNYDAIMEQTA